MKTLTKFFVVISLTIAGLCYTPKPAKADMFGVADVALLTQQILQFFQDMDISDLADSNFWELIKDSRDKVHDIKRIVNIFNNGQQGIATFNNIANCIKNSTRAFEQLALYIEYIGNIGDDFAFDKCSRIYNTFNRRSNAVLTSLNRVIKDLQSINQDGSQEGVGIFELMDKAISKANASLNTISNECISDLTEIIKESNAEKQAARVNEIANTAII